MGVDQPPRIPTWGEPPPSLVRRAIDRIQALLRPAARPGPTPLRELPSALRHEPLAEVYLAAEHAEDHAEAAAAAAGAMERAIAEEAWWPADVWAHRALWHYERAGLDLEAIRQARRIGELRSAAGDTVSARRYFAEAIDEARDVGAEREQGLATLGLGRALLDLGRVTEGRRLGSAAVDILIRAGAPPYEIGEAHVLAGREVAVGEPSLVRSRPGDA
jgi:GNAT superfamily N-acetyltransferase